MASEHKSGELEFLHEINGPVAGSKDNGLVLNPVEDHARGEGLPYAPADWPNPGDVWTWKAGKRKTPCGYMMDRYLYPPHRFQKLIQGKPYFRSLKSTQEFVLKEFPDADHVEFFASFSWKIPSKDYDWKKDANFDEVIAKRTVSKNNAIKCEARNKICDSQVEPRSNPLPIMPCDLCGSEPGFCHSCCCILCFKSIDWVYGGYSFIRCAAKVSETHICGHAAHIDCALRSYMAGTVGGTIRLDVEYHCRRCDNRTDLISHVKKFLKTCESVESGDDVEKILKLGIRILCDSQRDSAKRLLSRIESLLTKRGILLKDNRDMEGNKPVVYSGELPQLRTISGVENKHSKFLLQPCTVNTSPDIQIDPVKLQREIEEVLESLRSSQELEYRMAEERLNVGKENYVSLYNQLEKNKSEVENYSDVTALITKMLSTGKQLNQDMEEVAKGFGRISPRVLKDHFGLQVDE